MIAVPVAFVSVERQEPTVAKHIASTSIRVLNASFVGSSFSFPERAVSAERFTISTDPHASYSSQQFTEDDIREAKYAGALSVCAFRTIMQLNLGRSEEFRTRPLSCPCADPSKAGSTLLARSG